MPPPSSEERPGAQLRAAFKRMARARLGQGLVPYEGRWMTTSDRQQAVAARSKAQKIARLEFAALIFAIFLASAGLMGLIALIAY